MGECVGPSKKAVENALAVRKVEVLQGRYRLKEEIKSPLFETLQRNILNIPVQIRGLVKEMLV